jgi:hypothetical protein
VSEPGVSGLADAIHSLTELAAGRTPERSRLMRSIVLCSTESRIEIDAAAGLKSWAAGGLELDDQGRARAAFLADVVQRRLHEDQRRQPRPLPRFSVIGDRGGYTFAEKFKEHQGARSIWVEIGTCSPLK